VKRKKIGYFQREWLPSPLGGDYSLPHGYVVWLVFADSLGVTDQIRPILEQNGRSCILVEPGESFTVVRRDHYRIDPRVQEDYLALFHQVSQAFGRVDGILYLWSVHSDVNIVERQEQAEELLTLGVYGLFMVVQALLEQRLQKTLPLLTVTVNARYAAPGSWLSATNSALAALAKIIPYELKNAVAKNIDFSLPPSENVGQAVIQELCNWDGEEEISYQNSVRMTSRVQEIFIQHQPMAPLITEGSVVLISGGASGVGFKVAQHLAATRNVKLALVGRSRLPLEEAAEHLMERTDLDETLSKVRNIQLLQAKGHTVWYESADVANLDSMRLACKRIKERLGGIDALIHCAGVIDERRISLRNKTLDSFKAVLRPKVEGSLALARISREASIPVTIYFSSLASLSGATGVGFSDYAVANAFMDGLAVLRDGSHSGRTVSISWPVWEAVGMSNRGLTTKEAFALTQEEALSAFDMIVDRPVGHHVVVLGSGEGAIDFLRFSQSQVKVDFPARWTEQELAQDPQDAKPLETAAKTEWFLKETIGEFLKLDPDEIDSDINLGEYGVDSIAIADLMGRIEKRYGEHLDPSCILEHPTIATLSDFIDKRFGQLPEADGLAQEKPLVTPAGNGSSTHSLLKRLYEGDISAAEALEQLLEQI
jgi:NAD(P)-dependent dehydrogenase (short-subunit alcohol dehydrogenase family)/acyl carrier protein